MKLDDDKGRAYRRRIPISCSVGPNGAGKTLGMVWDTLPDLDAGRRVLSTVRLTDFRNPRPCDGSRLEGWKGSQEVACDVLDAEDHSRHLTAHPFYDPLVDFTQLWEAKEVVLLLDEITGIAGARDAMSLPRPVLNRIMQLRKGDSVVRYTSPFWGAADKVLRSVTVGVTFCSGYLPAVIPGRQWRSMRLHRWLTYDAQKLDDFEASDRHKDERHSKRPKAEKFALHWSPGSGVYDAYDTFGVSGTIGISDESGKCLRCLRPQKVQYCSCGGFHSSSSSSSVPALTAPGVSRLELPQLADLPLT